MYICIYIYDIYQLSNCIIIVVLHNAFIIIIVEIYIINTYTEDHLL